METIMETSRRDLLKHGAMAVGVSFGMQLLWGASAPESERRGDMLYRKLGNTVETVSLLGLGGFHIGIPDEQVGIRIIRTAIDRGVTFMDNCWDYHDGKSEQ